MLAGFQLTPTAPVDDQRRPAARMTDGSIRSRAAVSPAVARLLVQASGSSNGAGRLPRSFQSDSSRLLAVGGCQQRRPLVDYRFHVDTVVLATLSAVIAILGVHFPFLGGPEVSWRGSPIEFDCRSAQDAATRLAPATVAGVVPNRPPGQPHRGSRDGRSALQASRRRPPTGPLGVIGAPVSQIRADLAWRLGGAKGLSTASAACSEIVLAMTPASG